jgi:hypothetical protein
LRYILLLIIRTLIILLIVLAFARPTFHSPLSQGMTSNARTSAVIILDNSYSMNHKNGLTTARKAAKNIVQSMRPGDQVYLLSATDTSDQRVFHDFSVLQKEIDEIQIDYKPTDLNAAVLLGNNLLRKSVNINKEIYIISDFQKSGISDDSVSINRDIRVFAIPLNGSSVDNIYVDNIDLTTSILTQNKIAQLQVDFTNSSSSPQKNKLAQLFINDEKVAQTVLNLDGSASSSESFKFVLDKSGFIDGRVNVEEDDILEDNDRYLVLDVPDRIRVALFGHRLEDVWHLDLALQPSQLYDTSFDADILPVDRLRYLSFSEYDCLVLSNLPAVGTQIVEKLVDFVQKGGGLFIALGEDVDLRAYNGVLMPALKLPGLLLVMGRGNDREAFFSIGKSDLTHPVFNGIFEKDNGDFSKPRFSFAIKSQQSKAIDTIMEFSDGSPFLYESSLGEGTILVMTCGFDLALSDFPHQTLFAPLMTRSLRYLVSHRHQTRRNLLVGEELRTRIPNEVVNADLEIQRPDRKSDRTKPVITANGPWIYYRDTDIPGIYALLADQQPVAKWAVNVHPDESDLTKIETSVLKVKFNATVIGAEEDIGMIISNQRYGQEIWKALVFAALILSIIEMLLYREKGEAAVREAV